MGNHNLILTPIPHPIPHLIPHLIPRPIPHLIKDCGGVGLVCPWVYIFKDLQMEGGGKLRRNLRKVKDYCKNASIFIIFFLKIDLFSAILFLFYSLFCKFSLIFLEFSQIFQFFFLNPQNLFLVSAKLTKFFFKFPRKFKNCINASLER